MNIISREPLPNLVEVFSGRSGYPLVKAKLACNIPEVQQYVRNPNKKVQREKEKHAEEQCVEKDVGGFRVSNIMINKQMVEYRLYRTFSFSH
uniref:Transposase n=1 Tax=Caenorhabditis tropicalis TaxID=1561998 RepID=A0A1I7TZ62_9PELO